MAVTEADIPRIAKDSAAIYRKWQPLIDRYHGGVPSAMIAVRMKVESGGAMINLDTPGGGRLKEIGLLSVSANQEKRFGVPDGTRRTAEGNVFLAATRYNVDTALFLKRYPGLAVSLADAYIFGAGLVSGIGIGAAYYLFDRAPRGKPYKEFADWVEREGLAGRLPTSGKQWGSQSLATIIYRVRAFQYMAEAAALAQSKYDVPNQADVPVVPPRPSWLTSFSLPNDAAGALRMLSGGETPFIYRAPPNKPAARRGWIPALVGVFTGVATGAVAVIFGRSGRS